MNTALQLIHASKYKEFPDTLLTLELCRSFARLEGRKVGESLRKCAKALSGKVNNRNLQGTLRTMSLSLFPESEITRIRGCLGKMEAALTREVRDVILTEDNLKELAESAA